MYYEVKKMNNYVAKHYDKLNYTLYKKILDNGLKVIYLKKPGFHKYSCYFGCNIGGKVNKYEVDGKVYEIPLGVAHFLEHQMFEMEEGKALLKKWGINEKVVGVASLALGYPDQPNPEPRPRREGSAKIIK